METVKQSRFGASERSESGVGRLWRRHFRRQNHRINSFGARLEQARRERGLSQSRLARRAGLMPVTIADLESDARAPISAEVRALALALRMAANQLLDG